MKFILFTVLSACAWSVEGAIRYTYTGPSFSIFDVSNPLGVPEPFPRYSSENRITGWVDLGAPLAADGTAVNAESGLTDDMTQELVAWEFTDGRFTYASASPDSFTAATIVLFADSAGDIAAWTLDFERLAIDPDPGADRTGQSERFLTSDEVFGDITDLSVYCIDATCLPLDAQYSESAATGGDATGSWSDAMPGAGSPEGKSVAVPMPHSATVILLVAIGAAARSRIRMARSAC